MKEANNTPSGFFEKNVLQKSICPKESVGSQPYISKFSWELWHSFFSLSLSVLTNSF